MSATSALTEMIATFYDAALEPEGWARIATKLAKTFAAPSAVLFSRQPVSLDTEILSLTENYTPKILADYAGYYYSRDPWANRAQEKMPGQVCGSDDIISDAEFLECEIYGGICKPLGIFYVAGASLTISRNELAVLGLHRSRKDGLFNSEEKRQIEILLPHLQRALQIRSRLGIAEAQGRVGLAVLDRLGMPVFVVSASGEVMFANAEADRLLRSKAGLYVRNGVLRAANVALEGRLHRMIAEAAVAPIGGDVAPGGVLPLPREDRRPLSLLVSPLNRGALPLGPTQPMAMVLIGDPERRRPMPQAALAELYGLTKAETRLLVALLEGERLQDFAERTGVTANTAKTQLAQLFQKTGNNRQTDLIRDVLANPIWIAKNNEV